VDPNCKVSFVYTVEYRYLPEFLGGRMILELPTLSPASERRYILGVERQRWGAISSGKESYDRTETLVLYTLYRYCLYDPNIVVRYLATSFSDS
jgi:hypothetical protein